MIWNRLKLVFKPSLYRKQTSFQFCLRRGYFLCSSPLCPAWLRFFSSITGGASSLLGRDDLVDQGTQFSYAEAVTLTGILRHRSLVEDPNQCDSFCLTEMRPLLNRIVMAQDHLTRIQAKDPCTRSLNWGIVGPRKLKASGELIYKLKENFRRGIRIRLGLIRTLYKSDDIFP